MSSPSSAVVSAAAAERRRNKNRKKSRVQSRTQPRESTSHARWRSEAQEQIYSSKLVEALSKVNLNPTSPSAPRRNRAVRVAADRALASAARGRSLWSRAILSSSRVKLKFRKQQKRHPEGSSRSSTRILQGKKSTPAVQRKARVLGRLVPGCRKQPFPVVLEEATDYIAALEMQIKTMSALADLLSSSSSSATSSASALPNNN